MLSIIACISKVHRAIGYKNRLLYAIGHDPISYAHNRTYDHHGQEDI